MSFALVSVISMLVVLGIMVLVHEAGHFVTAKLCGVRVEVFSIGFGPRLFGFQRGDTDYRVCLLPLGGYVKMAGEMGMGENNTGENNDELAAPRPGDFTARPRWQRILIGLSGPAANFLLAFGLMTGLYMMHNEVDQYFSKGAAVIDYVSQPSAAAAAGLKSGDRIAQFGKVANPTWQQIALRMGIDGSETEPVTIARDVNGATQQLTLALPLAAGMTKDGPDPTALGLQPRMQAGPITVHSVRAGDPMAKAGIQAGDQLLSLNGVPLHSVISAVALLQENKARPVAVEISRQGKTFERTITPAVGDNGEGKQSYQLGFTAEPPPVKVEQQPFFKAAAHSVHYNVQSSGAILEVVKRLFSGRSSVKQLSGPVGIAHATGEAALMPGWQPIINLMAVISLNLGIVNLLPFPVLDGGLILMLLIESIMRHDLNPLVKERIMQVAVVAIVLLFIFITFNDVSRLVGFS